MKLTEAIEALGKAEATKALAETLKAELGPLAGEDAKELSTRFIASAERATKAEGQVKELTEAAKAVAGQGKEIEALKAKVSGFENEKRETILAREFSARAVEAGLSTAAVATARKLADLSEVQVDIEKGAVTGLTKEVFEGLKAAHPVLFAAPAAGQAPPLPAGSGGGAPPPNVGDSLPGGVGLLVQAGRL